MLWSEARTGDGTEETTGHFHADPSRSLVALYTVLAGTVTENDIEYTTCILVLRTTLSAHIHAAESMGRRTDCSDRDTDTGSASEAPTPDEPEPVPLSVPWADWGPRGCLRLHLRDPLLGSLYHGFWTPFGSRLPVLISDGSRNVSASMYVFDANPFVARSLHCDRVCTASRRECDGSELGSKGMNVDDADASVPRSVGLRAGATAVVEDIEEVVPDVVDPECAAVPYIVHRFPWPYSSRGEQATAPGIREVTMSMAGFTVELDAGAEYEKRTQTWTV